MTWASRRRARTLLVSAAILAALAVLVARLSRMTKDGRPTVTTWSKSQTPVASPTVQLPAQSQTNSTNLQSTPPAIASPASNTSSTVPGLTSPSSATLIIPVAGVRPEQLRDTFSD